MMERRLAAIMAADVVGYNRLMENNETATLDALRELYANVIEPNLAVRQGSLVQLTYCGANARIVAKSARILMK